MAEDFISISSKPRKVKSVKKVNPKNGRKVNKKNEKKINKKEDVKDLKVTPKMRLLFQERCPEASEIRQIHPKIKHVFVPKRPASVRYCILKFHSDEDLQEVRSALHKKHVEPYKGVLRCVSTLANRLIDIKKSNPEICAQKYLTKIDIKHAKFVHNKKLGATMDVKLNSTERELFVRYGILSANMKHPQPQNLTEDPNEESDASSHES